MLYLLLSYIRVRNVHSRFQANAMISRFHEFIQMPIGWFKISEEKKTTKSIKHIITLSLKVVQVNEECRNV